MLITVLVIIVAILLCLGCIALGGLVFWGLGLFVIDVFGINFVWTYLHGLACQLVFMILRSIFQK